MNRNVNDYFSKTPTPHFPRNKFDFGVHKRLQTQQHGRLYPFYCRMVYPGDTWQMDMSVFVRADTSLRVPLDDIYLDTYFFFVPFRILGKQFAQALGDVDAYDDEEHNLPLYRIYDGDTYSVDNIIGYLGYSQSEINSSTDEDTGIVSYFFDKIEYISAYPMAAYYSIWNDWFRDENVDPYIDYTDLYGQTELANLAEYFEGLDCLRVNKYHDYFTSGVISPTKGNGGDPVTIPLGLSAPVLTASSRNTTTANKLLWNNTSGSNYVPSGQEVLSLGTTDGDLVTRGYGTPDSAIANIVPANLVADLSNAAGTINELYLAMALNSLYNRRARFGTRYIETIRGQWGIEVPDSFFERPEYLGGSRTTLNNIPVLSTENSSQLGQMSGNSATLSGGTKFSKTFIEYGLIIGLSTTRIKHSYTQGKRKEIFDLKTSLDLYNPVFANIGFESIKLSELYNEIGTDDIVFNYQEAWAYLRTDVDSFAGQFGIFGTNAELKNKWHYGDYYDDQPSFSAEWLKEDFKNVARTMTGQLINGAGSTENLHSHQYMFGYYFHPVVTRILPAHSIPPEITGRI